MEIKSTLLKNKRFAAFVASVESAPLGVLLRKAWIVSIPLLGIAFPLLWLCFQTPHYRTTMIVSSVEGTEKGNLGLPTSLVNIAPSSITGLLGTHPDTKFEKFLATLKTHRLAEELFKNQPLMRSVFDAHWNKADARWDRKIGLRDQIRKLAFMLVGVEYRSEIGPAALRDFLSANLIQRANPQSGFVTISMDTPKPEIGQKLLKTVFETANDLLRKESRTLTEIRLDYLGQKLASMRNADHRASLIELVSEQEKTLLVAQIGTPFAAELLDGPISTLNPVFPNPMVTIPISVMVSFVMSTLFVVLIVARRENIRAANRGASWTKAEASA